MTRGEPLIAGMPDFAPGSVWLVGAGPGDPSLLTLAALSALRNADICIYDALVSREVLALAPRGVREQESRDAGQDKG